MPESRVSLVPEGTSWAGLGRRGLALTESARSLRVALGLPVDRPIVMSGHQAAWWHAGILAKYFAVDAAARTVAGHSAWVVVDQDANAFSEVRYPARTANGQTVAGNWASAPAKLAADQRADCALASLAPFGPQPVPVDGATPEAGRALKAIADCLASHATATSAGEQVARACLSLATTLGGGGPQAPTLVFASRLGATSAMSEMVDRMLADPAACVKAYNHAVAKHAVFGIAPLGLDASRPRYELPLWRLPPAMAGGAPMPRQRVYAHTLAGIPREQLAPRALLMTGLLRAFACDLFIHGTGGGATGEDAGYDRVAEDWLQNWLGLSLAPSVVATATLLLDLGTPPTVTLEDVRRSRRLVHAARHTPGLLGDAAAQAEKDSLVAQIRGTTDRADRRLLYRALHQVLDRAVQAHAGELGGTRAKAEALDARYAAEALLRDRTWPWPLHARPALLGLQREVERQIRGGS